MGKYFCLQLKRSLRFMLPAMLVAAILFGCLALAYQAVVSLSDDSQDQAKIGIGVVGVAGDTYLELGMMALTSFDSSRFAIEFVEMSEEEAESAMRRGNIAAFVVIPDGFMDAAMRGEIMQLKYVCTAGSVGLVTMLKDEILKVVENILVECQKGTFGIGDALSDAGLSSGGAVNDLSISYAEFVFARSKMYKVSQLGVSDGLGLEEYLLSGFCVVLLVLICLVFAPIMVCRDMSLARMLTANRKSALGQTFCDFAVYLLGILCIVAVLMVIAVYSGWLELSFGVFLQWIPVVIAVAAMSFLLYELTQNLISGVLLQFFILLAMCFVSGCLYPVTFFPDSVQKLAYCLPTGIARAQLAESFAGMMDFTGMLALLGYGGLFFALSAFVRKAKVAFVRG